MKAKIFAILKIIVCAVLIWLNILFFNSAAVSQKIKISDSKTISPVKVSGSFDADDFQIFTLVNSERIKRGLNQLLWDDKLAEIARDYSEKMSREDFFGHFDSNGQSVVERAKTAKLKHWSKIGENLFSIAGLDKFDAFAVKHWMNSPTHRDNILDKDWTTTGIGIAKSEDGEIFITQIFIQR